MAKLIYMYKYPHTVLTTPRMERDYGLIGGQQTSL
jgi:hypothetical protein